jgi:glycosyltransferase involved in cell wall biosynthesis
MGLPMVGTRIAGLPELVDDGEQGLLVAPGSVDDPTHALDRLVRSPEERRRMGRAGTREGPCQLRRRALGRADEGRARGRARRAHVKSVDEFPVPELEHEQCPDAL